MSNFYYVAYCLLPRDLSYVLIGILPKFHANGHNDQPQGHATPGDADGLDAARRMGMQMRTLAVSRCSIFVDHLGRLPTKARTDEYEAALSTASFRVPARGSPGAWGPVAVRGERSSPFSRNKHTLYSESSTAGLRPGARLARRSASIRYVTTNSAVSDYYGSVPFYYIKVSF